MKIAEGVDTHPLPHPTAFIQRNSSHSDFKWIWIAAVALTVLMVAGQQWPLPAPLGALRILLGLVFALLVPGYALQAALFPRSADLDSPERAALSFGLSVAVIPPLAVLLDRLPWGIRTWPIAICLGVFLLACATVAWYRRLRLGEPDQIRVGVGPRGWWRKLDRGSRIAYSVIAVAMVAAVLSTAIILLVPKSAERFTEFYLLGAEGLAQDYPREVVVGQLVGVTMGITNREAVAAEYRVEVRNGGLLAGYSGPVRLEPGTSQEGQIGFTVSEVGDNVLVTFLLFRDGAAEPYRTLKLWLKAKAAK